LDLAIAGKCALVTGASIGIGRAIALCLAKEGVKLAVVARRRNLLEELQKEAGKLAIIEQDFLLPEAPQRIADAALAALGRVDILVNNAGVTWAAEPEDMTLAQWQKVVDINLTGAFLFAQAAGRDMLTRQWGRIINIASIAGMHASVHGPHYAPYAATKAGLIGLTRELAVSWARKGIRVNAIAPGFFHSRLADGAIAMNEASIKASSPIPRVGDAGELKGVAVFLAADASNYITGQTIVVDGGRTIA